MPWDLEIKKEDGDVTVLKLGNGVFSVGREDADIKVTDVKVSKQHCNFYVQDSDIAVIDAGSTNGTFVNGIRVDKKDLKHNDVVIVGTTRIRVIKC